MSYAACGAILAGMGWIKDAKASALQKSAVSALEAGQWVFVAMLAMPVTRPSNTSEVNDWSLMIQSVEEVGWYVDRMTGMTSNSGHEELVVLFRRRPSDAR